MNWHVMTGSKGGIGKTLLTLLLLAYHLDDEEKSKGSTLVVDLNGTNADSSAILLYEAELEKPVSYQIDTKALIPQQAKQMVFQKTFSSESENWPPHFYTVAWPLNPYGLYTPTLFADLLRTIKTNATDIVEKLQIQQPLQHVIIDTNYHFCNIFAQQKEHYKVYTSGELKEENITVWFLWVYRQLDKLMNSRNNPNETIVVNLTAQAIERYLKRENSTPLMHVFNPGALISAQQEGKNLREPEGMARSLLSLIPRARRKDYPIGELKGLEDLSQGNYISFSEWAAILKIAHPTERFNDDPFFLLLDVLLNAITIWNRQKKHPLLVERPKNIIPLSIYQHGLQYYTDRNRKDPVSRLRKFKIYDNFKKLLW